MRKLNWASLGLDLIYILLGLVFIIHPEGVESALCYILATSVAVIGILCLLGWLIQKTDEYGHRQGNGFVFGVVLIILAVFIIAKQSLVIALVPFLFGVMVLIRGVMVIQAVFQMRRMGFPIVIPLTSGLLTVALGLFIMLFPFATADVLFILIGVGLIIGGISGILQEFQIWHLVREKHHAEERARDMEGAQTVEVMTVVEDAQSPVAVEPDLEAFQVKEEDKPTAEE